MVKANKFYWAVLFLSWNSLYAQDQHFNYKMAINGEQIGWNKATIPVDMYSNIQEDYGDIRIYGYTTDGDTIEAPYLIKEEKSTSTTKTIDFKLINQSETGGDYFFTYELKDATPINEIQVNFKEENFDWKIDLEGSMDQQSWYMIVKDYRIASIKNELTNYTFSTLRFPESKYNYFRVKLKGATARPNILSSGITIKSKIEGEVIRADISNISQKTVKGSKQTRIDIFLRNVVPVSSIHILPDEKVDFYRPFTLQCVTDSIETPAGWRVNTTPLTDGVLSSIEANSFHFPPVFSNHLIVIIDNHDNKPLNIDGFNVGYHPVHILFRIDQAAEYAVFYGNKNVRNPHYDVLMFKDNLPENVNEISLGQEKKIEAIPESDQSLFKNKIWLWMAIFLIMAGLGWFTLKMMKS